MQDNHIHGVKTERNEVFKSDHIILATGHSAQDIFDHLAEIGVHMEGKSFAFGLRVEHPQKLINQIQYREFSEHPKLGSANYRLADHNHKKQIGVYSFCMCPGGYVLSSGTETDGVVSNGMSNFKRNSPFANAAIVVSIDHEKNFKDDIWGGLKLRRQIEKSAFRMVQEAGGSHQLPTQGLLDFINQKPTKEILPNSCPSGAKAIRLDQLLADSIYTELSQSLEKFDKKMKGFLSPQAQLFGMETRTSCPIRVTRHPDTLQSISHSGLYPCGEGAGYAGGITSAACDGIRIADQIVSQLSSQAVSKKL